VTAADLWVLGNLTIDDLLLPDGSASMGMCGGNAIFAALGGRLWSESVGLSARIGPDFPRVNVDRLCHAGVQLALSEVTAPTIHNWALYQSSDRRRFIHWPESGTHVEQSLLPEEVPPAAGHARVCHVAPMPITVQSQLVEFLSPQPALVSLDPHDEYIVGAEATFTDLLGLVDVFMPSRQEAALLYGGDDPLGAARAFRAAGPRVVAIKLGVEGSLVFGVDFDAPLHVPAVPVETVDPTGAGDAFCGAFGVVYGRTGDPIEAALHATVAASFTVEHRGALSALPFNRAIAEQRLTWLRAALHTPRTEIERPCGWKTAS
jgi:sugar/nucleoside kinase (ribokinase family)